MTDNPELVEADRYKRFMVFVYPNGGHPSGGLDDCIGSFDTIDEANTCISLHKNDEKDAEVEEDMRSFYEVLDRIEGVVLVEPEGEMDGQSQEER